MISPERVNAVGSVSLVWNGLTGEYLENMAVIFDLLHQPATLPLYGVVIA